MGTQRLKMKNELDYRTGYTSRSCSQCNYFKSKGCLDDEVQPARCEIMGLKGGRLYRINPKSICDRFDNSIYLERLGRAW